MGLQELSKARGITVAGDSTDIRGWRALDAEGAVIGQVQELLFDPDENLVHFAVVGAGEGTRKGSGPSGPLRGPLGDRRVLWPVSRLGFHDRDRAVVLEGLRGRDVESLDDYDDVALLEVNRPSVVPEVRAERPRETQLPRRIELRAERLEVTKRPIKRGEVTITRQPISEPVRQDITLVEEGVEVTRRLVNRPATGEERIRTEGDVTIVPVIEERLVVEKRPFVVEEIVITKTRQSHVEQVEDTVRRDEVRIDDEPIERFRGPREQP
jgi:uncharacterized protein (TIGR02271 family)